MSVVRVVCPDCTGVVGFNYFPENRDEIASVEERGDIKCFCGDAIAESTMALLVDTAYTLGAADYEAEQDYYDAQSEGAEPDDSDPYGYGHWADDYADSQSFYGDE